MGTTFKLYSDKMGATDPSTYIGREGELFYDQDTGALRRSDGSTPGGISIPGSGLSNIVEDTTPQLGGNLDAQGNDITNIADITGVTQGDGNGDNVNIVGGAGSGTNKYGGNVSLTAGDSTGTEDGAAIVITGGLSDSGSAGVVSIRGGEGNSGDGGNVRINGGDSTSGNIGQILIGNQRGQTIIGDGGTTTAVINNMLGIIPRNTAPDSSVLGNGLIVVDDGTDWSGVADGPTLVVYLNGAWHSLAQGGT